MARKSYSASGLRCQAVDLYETVHGSRLRLGSRARHAAPVGGWAGTGPDAKPGADGRSAPSPLRSNVSDVSQPSGAKAPESPSEVIVRLEAVNAELRTRRRQVRLGSRWESFSRRPRRVSSMAANR